MQLSLNFGTATLAGPDIVEFRRRLVSALGSFRDSGRHEPVDQLVKSLISSRTHDEDSQATYDRLKSTYPHWGKILEASAEEVRGLLCPVTYADNTADWLPSALRQIVRETGVLSLHFLGALPVEQAHSWLQRLDGVGPKVAAAVMNFSRLKMRIMVVDTHVLRVAKRFGLVADKCDAEAARKAIMTMAPDAWAAEDFYELHWLMKRLGQMRCTHGWGRCGACPLAVRCERRNLPERTNVARLHFKRK